MSAAVRALALLLAAVALLSCDPRRFDDLAATTWLRRVDIDQSQLNGDSGMRVADGAAGAQGAIVLVAAEGGVASIPVAADGEPGAQQDSAAGLFTGASLSALAGDGAGRAYATTTTGTLFYFNTAAPATGAQAAVAVTSPGAGFGGQLVVGDLGVGGSTADVVVTADQAVFVLEDETEPVRHCTYPTHKILSAARGAPGEVFLGLDSSQVVTVALDFADGDPCTVSAPADLSVLPMHLASGYLDPGSVIDVVAAQDGVAFQVVLNHLAQTLVRTEPAAALAATGFGSSLVVADVDAAAAGDEVVVGSPGSTVDSIITAGRVDLYSFAAPDSFTWIAGLTVASPEALENFGRSLAAPRYRNAQDQEKALLAVGGAREVYIYFLVASDDTDPR